MPRMEILSHLIFGSAAAFIVISEIRLLLKLDIGKFTLSAAVFRYLKSTLIAKREITRKCR